MSLFKKRNRIITIINNDALYWALPEAGEGETILGGLPIDQFLSEETDFQNLPAPLQNGVNSLLLAPDYWLDNIPLAFQSKKRALTEAFLERKLMADYPDLPEIGQFVGYTDYAEAGAERELYTYFMRDPVFYLVYDKLASLDLEPHRITTLALVWEHKIKGVISDFEKEGSAFVHLLSSDCSMYFFFRGHYLFARDIALPATAGDASEQLNTLTYEINQSLYLFSQKARAEAGTIYLLSRREEDARELSDKIGRPVQDLSELYENQPKESDLPEELGPAAGLRWSDLSPSSRFLSLSQKALGQELAWEPVQKAGIIIGLVLVLLFGGETVALWKWYRTGSLHGAGTVFKGGVQKQTLLEYRDALDEIIVEKSRPSAEAALFHLLGSLPDKVWMDKIEIDVDSDPAMNLRGTVQVSGPDQFRDTVSMLLANLREHFQGCQELRMQDIDFEIQKTDSEQEDQTYLLRFRFGLP